MKKSQIFEKLIAKRKILFLKLSTLKEFSNKPKLKKELEQIDLELAIEWG